MNMSITGLNHITINVTDLEASKVFYERLLGLAPCGTIDMGDHQLTYYQLPQNVRLELITYNHPQPVREYGVMDRGIYRHFCLEADDLGEIYRKCTACGVKVTKEPGFVEKLGCDNMLLIDPNGVEVEIIKK